MRINLPGSTSEIRITLLLSEKVTSTKEFLLEVRLFQDDLQLEGEDLDVFYSQALDINFVMFPDVDSEWLSLRAIKSKVPFDSIELHVRKTPWAKSAQTVEDLELLEAKFAARAVSLDGSSEQVHVLGRA